MGTDGKRRVTVWIDPHVLMNTLGYARLNEREFSDVVEEALRDKIGEETYPTFAEYWRGRFKVGNGTDQELLDASDDPRYQYLIHKYLSLDAQSDDPD